jgi:prevent-host-death family protein
MENIGIGEARRHFSELVERASSGQKIGITRHGNLVAMIIPAPPQESLEQIFRNLDEIRKGSKKLPKGVTVKNLIEEGRV